MGETTELMQRFLKLHAMDGERQRPREELNRILRESIPICCSEGFGDEVMYEIWQHWPGRNMSYAEGDGNAGNKDASGRVQVDRFDLRPRR
jgi:hypothetical protein